MNHLKVLNRFFLKYKWHFLGGLLFVALSTIFKIYQGVIVREGSNYIMDIIGAKKVANHAIFIRYGLTLISLALISGLFMFLMRQTIIVMSRHIEYDQKNEIYHHYQILDAAFYKRNTTGDLMNRISEDVSRVRMYTGPAIMYLANTVVTAVTVLVFMLSINVELTLLVFLPLPVLTYIIYKVSDMIGKQSLKVQAELSSVTTVAQESFSAIRLIKAYARESHFAAQMEEKSSAYREKALKLSTIEAWFSPTMVLMVGLSVLITVWYGGSLTIQGKIEPGNIPEFILYVFMMTWPFASLGWVTSLIQRASASQERINEFLESKPSVVNHNTKSYTLNGNIEFKNVSFVYPDSNVKALDNVSFSISAGETIGITGPVACGKSTILALITRQFDVSAGEIFIDGKNIKEHNLDLLRQHTGVVTQEVFLFSDTIRNNISFGDHNRAEVASVEQAAKQAGVYDNIAGFPDKFETLVGERGVTLSGGQKQRISIARALIGKPRMLLFDDCLSAVDVETEEQILQNLRSEMKGKTSILVSHRISTIKDASKILVLDKGILIESGTHQQLLDKKGEYHRLYLAQSH